MESLIDSIKLTRQRLGSKELLNKCFNKELENVTYIKINNIKYKGYDVYYKKHIDNIMTKATVFNDNYNYFFKNDKSSIVKPLGKYKRTKNSSSDCRYYDIDYYIYEFENDEILSNNKDNIYSIELSILYDNMVLIDDLIYEEYSVYYRITN